ncbi:hypothetical protein HDU87_008350 [Geranomyces variabilis]|uniref:Heme haloperoxidase family profile domain-containing protein n=1 Tax=Geranomyces variabilis TaxID=109894 RepID=A0AAD5TIF3_9FUNG|nr:hypothetical protein HDU87_008350 [Geranomyces variabilis]
MSTADRSQQADVPHSSNLSPAASAPPIVAAADDDDRPASSPLPPTAESSSRHTPPPPETVSPKLSSSPHRGRPPSALHRPRHTVDAHHYHRPSSSRDVSPVRTEFGDDQREEDVGEDKNDTISMRSAATSRTLRAAARPRPITKSQKISSMQNIFTESQKIAYVGLCYLSIVQKQKADLKGLKKANESYAKWAEAFMEKLYIFLDIKTEERVMIKSLADHGLVPSDLSKSLIDDALKAARVITERQEARQRAEEEALEKGLPPDLIDSANDDGDSGTAEGTAGDPTDIRYTILSHLFILCIMEGRYDARSRTVLKNVARYLEVPWADVVQLEEAIATQLRIYEDSEAVSGNVEIVGKRNEADTKRRWIFTGLATLAGGAVIGLTAGLAAPLIAGGIGVALGTFGVTGASAALSTTGALALITTGGVLTGGGMGGVKMMKRTKGITQFEFLTLADGMKQIELNKEKRRTERRKKRRREAREALQEKMDHQRAADKKSGGKGVIAAATTATADELAETEDDNNNNDKAKLASAQQAAEEYLPAYEAPTDEKLDRIGNWVNITDSQRVKLDAMDEGGAPLMRKGSRSAAAPPPVPNRPTAQELAEVTENRLSVSAGRLPPPPAAAATAARRPSDAGRTDDNPNGAVWGLEEGFSWPDHENAPAELHHSLEAGFDEQVGSTVLWESLPQLASESGSAPLAGRPSREVLRSVESNLDDAGTIDEEMAAAMFDDLQSTVDGDHAAYGDDDDDIRFKEPEGPPKAKQTNVLITVAGWITYGPDDHTLPFSTLEPDSAGDQYALLWETDTLQELGSALKLLVGEVASFLVQQGLQATVLSALMIGLAGPLWVMKLSYLVDNPWGIGLSKANKAGKTCRSIQKACRRGRPQCRPATKSPPLPAYHKPAFPKKMLKSSLFTLAFASLACAGATPQWIAPTADAVRSPCPMLNALANHGVIARDGKNIKPSEYLAAVQTVGLAADVGSLFAYGGAVLFDHESNANGDLVYSLADARKHGAVEHDASLTRNDFDLANGDNFSFNRTLYDQMVSFQNSNGAMDAWSYALIRVARQQDSLARNPNANLGFTEKLKSHAEVGLIMNILGWQNGATEVPVQYLNAFFVEERLPFIEGWTPSSSPVGFAKIVKTQTEVENLEKRVPQ